MRLPYEKVNHIDFPSGIDFTEKDGAFVITMHQDGTSANMQSNAAAFEAWALVAKSAGYERVVLSESESTRDLQGIEELHYNRFLYRVSCFAKGFNWFSISDELKAKVEIFENTELKQDLFVNAPLSEPKIPDLKSHEAVMERRLVQDGNCDLLNDILGTKIGKFYQQLPFGLFKDRVITENAVMPSDKAAIDIWGLDGRVFHLVELKVRDNQDLGVLSELFFYACFINEMYCNRHLETKDPADLRTYKKDGELYRGYSQLINANIDSVVAHILTEKKHPRLDDAFAELQKHKLDGIVFANAKIHPLFDTVSES